ncbi:MAG TPA: hypothetical protein VGI82_06915 [Chitinophagaceae bacterium]
MGTRLLFSFMTIVFVAISSCHKLCIPAQYDSTGGVATISPDLDSVRVGDTLLFNSIILTEVRYSQGASDSGTYNLSGAKNVATDIHLTSPTGFNQQVGAVDSFLFLPKKGAIVTNELDPTAAKSISYVEENGNYIFQLGIIAQKKGIYFFDVIDIYQAMKKCDKISVTVLLNNADNHLHYLKDIYYGGGAISPIDSTHTYCFKVY